MARVELDRVGKRYPNGFTAVAALSLDVASGEFIALVGPSGCGKSTTLRMVAGLENITEGELRIGERRVNEVAPKDRDVAMVFQSYALYPHMTVYENMAFGLRLKKLPEAEIDTRVQDAAARLGLGPMLQRKPREMSGGQRQRVAMGRAIVRRPKVFLFDEPLSNLDAKLRLQMRVEVGRLHRSLGSTSIYVTHDQVEAMTLADRIVLMKDGVVQQVGAPLDLYGRPQNTFVATFIGSPAMNLAAARLEGREIISDGWRAPAPSALAEGASEVLAGLRPEHLRLAEGAVRLRAEVEVLERVGRETFVHARQGERRWCGTAPADASLRPGEVVELGFDPVNLHVFDVKTEARR